MESGNHTRDHNPLADHLLAIYILHNPARDSCSYIPDSPEGAQGLLHLCIHSYPAAAAFPTHHSSGVQHTLQHHPDAHPEPP